MQYHTYSFSFETLGKIAHIIDTIRLFTAWHDVCRLSN